MRPKTVQVWMSNEMERLSMKLERYKPTGSGYNRMKPVLLPKSVAQMLNNPLPAEEQIRSAPTPQAPRQEAPPRTRGVLSRSESEWEEVYPTVKFSRHNSRESGGEAAQGFAFYRNCSTRIT